MRMKQFSIDRFTDLIVWSLRTEHRFCQSVVAALVVVIFLSTTLVSLTLSIPGELLVDAGYTLSPVSEVGLGFCLLAIYIVALTLGFSLMFHVVNAKRTRTAFLQQRATNAEKFFSRVVLVVGGGVLMLFLSTLLADGLRIIFVRIVTGATPQPLGLIFVKQLALIPFHNQLVQPISEATPTIELMLGPNQELAAWHLTKMLVHPLCNLSLFAFCSIAFRKAPWAWGLLLFVGKEMAAGCLPESWVGLEVLIVLSATGAIWWSCWQLFCQSQNVSSATQ